MEKCLYPKPSLLKILKLGNSHRVPGHIAHIFIINIINTLQLSERFFSNVDNFLTQIAAFRERQLKYMLINTHLPFVL